jgi:hypothetical protein
MGKLIAFVLCAGLSGSVWADGSSAGVAISKHKKTVTANAENGGVSASGTFAPNCPAGTVAVRNTDGGIAPYTCIKLDPAPKPVAPNCPAGTVAVRNTDGGIVPYTCITLDPAPTPIAPSCPAGAVAVRNTDGGIVPYYCIKPTTTDDRGGSENAVSLLR